ncbi:MAG: chorismate synthase [Candidatus Velthaea sp.]
MSLRYLTAGESHGRALVGIIEGVPAGLAIDVESLHAQLKRRKLGYGRGNRQNIETDEVEILTGVRFGETLGSPISLVIANRDWRSWTDIMAAEPPMREGKRKVTVPRPGHADYVGGLKYGHGDMRNVLERSSARETAMRVALGSVARAFLAAFDIAIASRVVRVGPVEDTHPLDVPVHELNARLDAEPLRVLDADAQTAMCAEVDRAKADGDTLGGVFEVYASNLAIGLGSYAQWDRRIEAEIGRQFLSLNAIKGVEIGGGFRSAARRGSAVHDEYLPGEGTLQYGSNNSGGIDGGMTTGETLVVRAGMKPISTLMKPLRSVDLTTGEATNAHIERSDTCAVPAAAVIGESLLALVLADALLEKFGGDSIAEIVPRVRDWQKLAAHR